MRLGYYFALALRSLRRNPALTVLTLLAIGVGISASMTIVTVYRGMAADPIPMKSTELFAPQVDNWGPTGGVGPGASDHLQDQLSYVDATRLMAVQGGTRQAAMYQGSFVLKPEDPNIRPFNVLARATYRDFFPMFDVPFQYGGGWTAADDEDRGAVTVITRELNDRLFGGADSVGRTLRLNDQDYRIVGVLSKWTPIPRFYYLSGDPFGKPEDVFVPFTRAIAEQIWPAGNWGCNESGEPGWSGFLRSDCVWTQFWVELPTASSEKAYRALLVNYAAVQQRTGRFNWPPHVQLRDVREWLAYHHVVSDEVRLLVGVSFGFLFVCLLNAMGLMLAKTIGRAGDIGVRRALGASSRAIFAQCLIEAGVTGLAGGLLGLALVTVSLAGLRSLLSEEGRALLYLDAADVAITIITAVAITILVGLYPTWRAARLPPALQLKTL